VFVAAAVVVAAVTEADDLASNPPEETMVEVDPLVAAAAAEEDKVPAVVSDPLLLVALALERRSRPFLELPYPARSTMGGAAGRFTSLLRFFPNFFLLAPPPVKEAPKAPEVEGVPLLLDSAVEDNEEVVPRMMKGSDVRTVESQPIQQNVNLERQVLGSVCRSCLSACHPPISQLRGRISRQAALLCQGRRLTWRPFLLSNPKPAPHTPQQIRKDPPPEQRIPTDRKGTEALPPRLEIGRVN
jgi:hypothetical protein